MAPAGRRLSGGSLVGVLVFVLVLGAALAPAVAAARAAGGGARPGTRVSVGLFGDSVTEGIVIPDFEHAGLAAALTAAERGHGFRPGGQGLIAANQYQWHFNRYGIFGFTHIPSGGWALVGAQDSTNLVPGTDGPSGYSAETRSATATATATVDDPEVEVLYTTSLIPCSFAVTTGRRRWRIDSYRPGIEMVAAQHRIVLGPGRHRLTVHGASCGGLIFDGVVAQRPVVPGTTQIQVDNDGHSARLPGTDLRSRVEEAILQRRYAVSVFLYGYIGEITVSPGAAARAYEQGLLTRARLARMHGGACLIVAPTPMQDVSAVQVSLVAVIEHDVARRAGCTYTTALTHLWNPGRAVAQHLLVIDGIHPTAAGYRRIARALAPIVAALARRPA